MTRSLNVLAPTRTALRVADSIEFRNAMSRTLKRDDCTPELAAKMRNHLNYLTVRNLREVPVFDDEIAYERFIDTAEEIVADRREHARRCAQAKKRMREEREEALDEMIYN